MYHVIILFFMSYILFTSQIACMCPIVQRKINLTTSQLTKIAWLFFARKPASFALNRLFLSYQTKQFRSSCAFHYSDRLSNEKRSELTFSYTILSVMSDCIVLAAYRSSFIACILLSISRLSFGLRKDFFI